jgi:probable lipoprotein NlpC
MKSDLSSGDLVFFNTSRKKRKGINHVGLFLKNGYFIHASTSRGVIISNLKEDYYRKTWKQGGRVK